MMKNFTHTIILLFLAAPLFAQVNLDDQLLLHYDFSGNSNDISGNNINGTANGGPALTTDRFGETDKAYFFDGTDDYISIPSSSITPDEYSYSLWVHPTANDGVTSLLSIGDAAINQSILLSFVEGWVGGSYIDEDSYIASTTDLPELNKWYHIVVLRTKTTIQLYINGELINEDNTIPNLAAAYGENPVAYVGRRSTTTQYFNGKIDEVRIYGRIINEDEIDALFDVTETASISPSLDKAGLTVYPNPSSGKFKVELVETGDYTATLSNAIGETIYKENFSNINGFTIDPLEKNGIYYLNVKSSKGISTERIIVTNQ